MTSPHPNSRAGYLALCRGLNDHALRMRNVFALIPLKKEFAAIQARHRMRQRSRDVGRCALAYAQTPGD